MENNAVQQFCGSCGAKVAPEKSFCGNCGTPVRIKQITETVKMASPASPGKLYCGHCGSEINPGVSFCGNCGAKTNLSQNQSSATYRNDKKAAQPLALHRIAWIGVGIVGIIGAILIINALTQGGLGGPTTEDIVRSSNFAHGIPNSVEIVYKAKCKLTDLDRARGYEQKWWVEFRKTSDTSGFIFADAWAYDGYEWNDYFATDSTVGCPRSR